MPSWPSIGIYVTEFEPNPDDRSGIAKAFQKATEVTTIAFMMVFPTLPGYWLDTYLNTVPLFTMLGFAFGMTGGIWQLIKMANRPEQQSSGTGQSQKQYSDEHVDDHERREQG